MAEEQKKQMNKAEALAFLGLEGDASDFAVDEKFWQLSKNARAIKDDAEREKRMEELSYAYDVATGREEARLKAQAAHDNAKKYFGKTAEEWKVYFGYTWYKYLLIIAGIVVLGMIGYRVFLAPKQDFAVLTVAHYNVENQVMTDRLMEDGYKNPYVANVDYAGPNDEGQENGMYADMTASVLFSSRPEVVITDEKSVNYFFVQYADIAPYYAELKSLLPSDKYALIEPVYYSEYEAAQLSVQYQIDQGATEVDTSVLDEASTQRVMIGLKIKDSALIDSLGFINMWPESEPNLIFSIGANGEDRQGAENFILEIFMGLDSSGS